MATEPSIQLEIKSHPFSTKSLSEPNSRVGPCQVWGNSPRRESDEAQEQFLALKPLTLGKTDSELQMGGVRGMLGIVPGKELGTYLHKCKRLESPSFVYWWFFSKTFWKKQNPILLDFYFSSSSPGNDGDWTNRVLYQPVTFWISYPCLELLYGSKFIII